MTLSWHKRTDRRSGGRWTMKPRQKISDKLNRVNKGSSIKVEYFECGNYITEKGKVSRIDYSYKFLVVNAQKIWFDDIMDIDDYVPYGRETWL